jgi:3-deoxy-7-phosphoheptulonate synthase
VSREAQITVHAARQSLQALRDGYDKRSALVIGPRSLQDPEAAFDYACRLRRLAESLSDEHLVLMRLRVEDLVNDPQRDGSRDPNLGLATARQVLLRINELGLPCVADAGSFAQPYLSDLIAWSDPGDATAAGNFAAQALDPA